ncbi:hypothetical protein EN816_40060, partial [Mesorhizobium sp. M8A.F.Ca.ET.173.01.1.1]
RIRIVAVEPEGAPTLHRAFEAGHPVDAPVPIDVFYPLSHHQVAMLLDPDLSLSDIGTPRTLCIHLFLDVIHSFMNIKTPFLVNFHSQMRQAYSSC